MYFRHWLFHVKQQHCKQSTPSITLEWTIQICSTVLNTHWQPSFSLPPSLSSYIFLPSLPSHLSSSLCLSLTRSFPFVLSSSILRSFSLLPFISIFHSISLPPPNPLRSFSILLSLYFASLLFYMHSCSKPYAP